MDNSLLIVQKCKVCSSRFINGMVDGKESHKKLQVAFRLFSFDINSTNILTSSSVSCTTFVGQVRQDLVHFLTIHGTVTLFQIQL